VNADSSKSFIAKNGTELENARLQYILYGSIPNPDVLNSFTRLQNEDGGFPCGLQDGSPSSLERTHLSLWWLEELGTLNSIEVDSAIEFLVRKQSDDGSWDENLALPRQCLPAWIIPGDLLTILYLTAYSAYWLGVLGRREHPAFQKALDYLLEYQDDTGEYLGYLHTTWLATSAFIIAGDQYSITINRGMLALMDRPLSEYVASQLAWLLNCFSTAGISRGHHVTSHFLIKLRQLRRPDGSWASEDGDTHAVDSTIESLRALKCYGILN
jgi:prenyltransferase beta subunit